MKKVLIAIVVLALIVGATAILNRQRLEENLALQKDAILLFRAGDIEKQVDFNTIGNLPEEEFPTVLRGSGRPGVDVIFTGVQLKDILAKIGLSHEGKTQVVTRAVDGFTVAFSMKEVLEDGKVYVVFKQDGEALGTRADGGTGPYRLVIRGDQFAQRWTKYLTEIELL